MTEGANMTEGVNMTEGANMPRKPELPAGAAVILLVNAVIWIGLLALAGALWH